MVPWRSPISATVGRSEFKQETDIYGDKFITINVDDNTRKIRPIRIDSSRPSSDFITRAEEIQLRSVVGSLSWIARQGRPDLLYRVSNLQSNAQNTTVHWMKEAKKAVEMALNGIEKVRLRYLIGNFDWARIGVLSVSDASFGGEPGMKSQQGRCRFLVSTDQLKEKGRETVEVLPISFSSTTIKRVCRATLQAETYSVQSSMESGDRIRALLAEMKGKFPSNLKDWESISRACVPHLSMSDCRSLTDHVCSQIPARIQDKRLNIEMTAIRQALWTDDGKLTWEIPKDGGD